jgi:hypothetical protein
MNKKDAIPLLLTKFNTIQAPSQMQSSQVLGSILHHYQRLQPLTLTRYQRLSQATQIEASTMSATDYLPRMELDGA